MRHARTRHPIELAEAVRKAKVRKTVLRELPKRCHSVPYSKSSKVKANLDKALVSFICVDSRPLSVANGRGFMKFIRLLDPR